MPLDREVAITWLGHSTFLVETPRGKTLLLDPFLEQNPKCPPDRKSINKCDLILVSHAHGDHMADAIPVANKTGAGIVAIFELAEWFTKKGVKNATGIGKGGTFHFDGISVTMVNAFHSSSIEEDDQFQYGGEPAGFVVRLENGFCFYHAGDTTVFGDMALIADLYSPELAMLPIGDHYTMGPREAALAIKLLRVKHVIPMHWGTFPVLTGTPDALISETRGLAGLTIYRIEPGDTVR
jgi:L-ascorbate metabolism protein UlaG (beta-lactamase superfamily)